jgi:hypothetical protein
VEASVVRVMTAWAGSVPPAVAAAAAVAAQRARDDVMPRLRALLAADIDDQRTTPLAIVRDAVRYPTEVLVAAGVPPVQRDDFAVRAFPDDAYNLAPATFASLDPNLAEAGIAWGAAKAFEHKRRHGPDGEGHGAGAGRGAEAWQRPGSGPVQGPGAGAGR